MLKANIKTNAKHLQKKYKRLEKKLPRLIDKGLLQAGFHLLEIMKELTKKGIDFRRMPFAPYSEGYIRRLSKEGKQTGVDLFYSGRMLGSLTPSSSIKKTGRGKISVAFGNSQMMQRALFNQVLNEPKRKFFGFDNRTEKIINKGFEKFVAKELRRVRI